MSGPLFVVALLVCGACHGGSHYSESACIAAMTAAKARAAGTSLNKAPSAFVPTIDKCSSLEEWTQSAKAAGVRIADVPRFVGQVCALVDLHRQEAETCQQTQSLVPFG